MSNPQWQDMSRDERVQYLTPLIGIEVRFVQKKEFTTQQEVLGPYAPIDWGYGVLQGLRVREVPRLEGLTVVAKYSPALYIRYHVASGGIIHLFDDLSIIEADPEPQQESVDIVVQEVERLQRLRIDLADFVEARKDLPQYHDICQLLSLFIAKSEG